MAVLALVRKPRSANVFRKEPGAVGATNVEEHNGTNVHTTSAMMRSVQLSNYQATGLWVDDDFGDGFP